MDSLHDLLMTEFRKYFDASMDWEMHRTHAAGIRTRNHLLEIRKIAKLRRDEIQAIRAEKPKVKSPKYREQKLKEMAQKKKAEDGGDTN